MRTWKVGRLKPRTTQVELPKLESEYEAWFDGACWPNPNGHAAWGALVKHNGQTIFSSSGYLGREGTSNNVAEYAGLNDVLDYLLVHKIQSCVIYGDSNLVIKQMNKEWSAGKLTKKEISGKIPIRARYYVPQYNRAQATLSAFSPAVKITFRWTPREKNTEADELSKKPLVERGIREVYTWRHREQNDAVDYLNERFEHAIAE